MGVSGSWDYISKFYHKFHLDHLVDSVLELGLDHVPGELVVSGGFLEGLLGKVEELGHALHHAYGLKLGFSILLFGRGRIYRGQRRRSAGGNRP